MFSNFVDAIDFWTPDIFLSYVHLLNPFGAPSVN